MLPKGILLLLLINFFHGTVQGQYKEESKEGVIVVRKKADAALEVKKNRTKDVLKNPKSDYQPRFPGGNDSIAKFFKEYMIFPKEALKNSVVGRVDLAIVIDRYGNVESASVTQSLGFGCDEEAIRLVYLMKWMPAVYSSIPTRKRTNISVPFNYHKLID